MCSLIGIYRFPGTICKYQDHIDIKEGLKTLYRRGPDQEFLEQVDSRCILGGNRLIIQGNKQLGRMPFVFDNYVGCYNGEIYNSQEYTDSKADGESLLPAYQKHGVSIGEHLDGEFAICIWDSSTATLLLSRDHFGTKPLFFAFDQTRLVWSSSARVISIMMQRELCTIEESPAYQHTYATQEPYSSFQGVWSIPPGHTLIVSNQEITLRVNYGWPIPTSTTNAPLVVSALWESLISRMTYDDTIAIPMSAGIDSGILAFAAERMGIPYHIFSLTKIFGIDTVEAPFIEERLSRLPNAKVTLIDCTEKDYANALHTIYSDSYYDSEYLDNGAILTYCVAKAVHKAGLKVLIDGTGGDELFDGYDFRDDLKNPLGWPALLSYPALNSIYTTLLAYTMKVDRAGGYYSFEARFPFQSRALLHAAIACKQELKKAPLRNFLLNELYYGAPLSPDISGKYGFSMRGHDVSSIRNDMRRAWLKSIHLPYPIERALRFPFRVGYTTTLHIG